MGAFWRRLTAKRVLGNALAPGEVLLNWDSGKLDGGPKVIIYLSDRAMHLVGGGVFRRISYIDITSILDTTDLQILISNANGEFVSVTVRGLVRGKAVDFVHERLIAVPQCRRMLFLDNEPWEFDYHPWRQGAMSAWLIRPPKNVHLANNLEMLSPHLSEFTADVEAIAAGLEVRGWVVAPLPEHLPQFELLRHWAGLLGGLRLADMSLAQSSEAVAKSQVTVLAITADSLRVVEIDLAAQAHPRMHEADLDLIDMGDAAAGHRQYPVTVRQPGLPPTDWVTYFVFEIGNEDFLARLRDAIVGR